jgi:hypothetical protein
MKAHPQIKSTKDYGQFVHHEFQQTMSNTHIKKLAESMRQNGFLPSKPIQVYPTGEGRLGVIDGHHRLAAASLIGIPVFYLEEQEQHKELIGVENALVRRWSMESFIRLYAGKGNKNYITLLRYVKNGIPISCAASLLGGQSAHSGNCTKEICTGNFRVKTTEHIDAILFFITSLESINENVKKRPYIEALSLLLFLPEFDKYTLEKRIESNPLLIVPCSTREQALQVFEDVYNFRSRDKVPLAHLAKMASKNRGAAKRD